MVEEDVLCFAWQDNSVVLALSTLHSPSDFVARERRRPAKTSTNGALVRKIFGEDVTKELDIPVFINDYNHYMGAVDQGNQLRASYTCHHKSYCNWLPLFYFFIDAAIVNAYQLQYVYHLQQDVPRKDLPTQYFFRERLYLQLLQFAKDAKNPPPTRHPALVQNHRRQRVGKKVPCAWCQHQRSAGLLKTSRASRTTLICMDCNVGFCIKGSCWTDFHTSASPPATALVAAES